MSATPFAGRLEQGQTYVARVERRADRGDGEWTLAERVVVPHHHAWRVEWSNLSGHTPVAGRWTFVVEDVQRAVVGERQVRTTFVCRILGVSSSS